MLSNPLITGSSQGFRKACTRIFYSISTVRLTGSRFVVRVSSKSSNFIYIIKDGKDKLYGDNLRTYGPLGV
jgi:hypothetical protein